MTPEDVFEASEAIEIVLDAVKTEDDLILLETVRNILASRFAVCSPGESASLSKQLLAVNDQIKRIRAERDEENDDLSEFEEQFDF